MLNRARDNVGIDDGIEIDNLEKIAKTEFLHVNERLYYSFLRNHSCTSLNKPLQIPNPWTRKAWVNHIAVACASPIEELGIHKRHTLLNFS
jgi:hypothetical protein